jgi:pimeloyl-ACP methyl ester carboxylesterase
MPTLFRCALISCALCFALAPSALRAQDEFFDSNGVQIHYIERGAGEPLVLVHGRGESLQTWIDNGVLPDLARDYRVIAIDVRGHGMSGKPHDPKQYGSEMALDIVRLLDHLGISRAHIVGYSLGANITSQLLTMHPDRFITATLGGGAGRFRWTARDGERFEQEAAETEIWGFSPSLALDLAPANAMPTEADTRKRSDTLLADPKQDRFAIAALVRSFGDQVVSPEQVAAVKVPTLGIGGSADPRLSDLRDLKELRPPLKLVVIDGATHSGERGARTRPEFVTAIREFIASQPTVPGAPPRTGANPRFQGTPGQHDFSLQSDAAQRP